MEEDINAQVCQENKQPYSIDIRSVKIQLEKLFTREGILNDLWLSNQFSSDLSIPIDRLISHPSLEKLKLTTHHIRQIAEESTFLQLVDDDVNKCEAIKPKFDEKRTTLIFRQMPTNLEAQEFLDFLLHAPPISSSDNILSIQKEFNNTWFVKLNEEETAQQLALWSRSQTLKGKALEVRVKSNTTLNYILPMRHESVTTPNYSSNITSYPSYPASSSSYFSTTGDNSTHCLSSSSSSSTVHVSSPSFSIIPTRTAVDTNQFPSTASTNQFGQDLDYATSADSTKDIQPPPPSPMISNIPGSLVNIGSGGPTGVTMYGQPGTPVIRSPSLSPSYQGEISQPAAQYYMYHGPPPPSNAYPLYEWRYYGTGEYVGTYNTPSTTTPCFFPPPLPPYGSPLLTHNTTVGVNMTGSNNTVSSNTSSSGANTLSNLYGNSSLPVLTTSPSNALTLQNAHSNIRKPHGTPTTMYNSPPSNLTTVIPNNGNVQIGFFTQASSTSTHYSGPPPAVYHLSSPLSPQNFHPPLHTNHHLLYPMAHLPPPPSHHHTPSLHHHTSPHHLPPSTLYLPSPDYTQSLNYSSSTPSLNQPTNQYDNSSRSRIKPSQQNYCNNSLNSQNTSTSNYKKQSNSNRTRPQNNKGHSSSKSSQNFIKKYTTSSPAPHPAPNDTEGISIEDKVEDKEDISDFPSLATAANFKPEKSKPTVKEATIEYRKYNLSKLIDICNEMEPIDHIPPSRVNPSSKDCFPFRTAQDGPHKWSMKKAISS